MDNNWLPTQTTKGGEALWLSRLCVLTSNSVREYGMQSGKYTLQIPVPTLAKLTEDMYVELSNDITSVSPITQPKFVEAVDDI